MVKRNADELRHGEVDEEAKKNLKRNPIYIILDDVLDTYNIGSVFRLADAIAAEKVILCKGSETPPNSRIKKASINTTEWIPWEYFEKTTDAIKKLQKDIPGIKIIAVELDKRSVPYDSIAYAFPVAIVVGHESDGVSEEVLTLCDKIVELPMFGINISLNVMVSLSIVLYEVVKYLDD